MPKSRGRRKKSRAVPMFPGAAEIVRQQIEAFRKKFGRDPGPGDPLFFDRDKDLPTPLDLSDIEDEVMQALRKVGVEPQIIYAYKKTGLIGVAGAINNWPADRRKEWEDSIDEYFALEEQAKAKRKSSHDQ
jgi:hypothetical protein